MITKERLSKIENLGQVEAFPGWLCNRHALIHVSDEVATQYERFPIKVDVKVFEALIASLVAGGGVDVKEDDALRIPYVSGDYVECEKCEGEGHVEFDCDCPNCDGQHDCEACDGEGGTGSTRKEAGQLVFVGAGKPVLLQESYAQLLEGMTVRFDTDNERFLVYDKSGEGVAMVMVVRGDPVKP